MNWILAIDFGTSNTAAAMRHPDGRVTAIKLDSAGDTMPSSVIVTDRGFRVGQAALNARRSYPDGFVGSPKERLGRGPVMLGDQELEPNVLVAQVLQAVRDKALRTVGSGMPSRLVLTHPVRWGQQRLNELLDAARQAGFDPSRTFPLPEPIAALHAHVSPKTLAPGARVAVVDVGGGTSDVAILQATGDPVPGKDLVVVAQDGDDRLGGNDLDAIVMGWVRTQLKALGRDDMLTALDDPRNLGSLLTLRDIVRGAKQDLSEHADAPIGVAVGGLEVRLTVTRDEYEHLIADSVTRMAGLVSSAMAASGTSQGIAGLYLTGGTAYTPALARVLHSSTGILAAPMGDPKLATALGALRTPIAVGGVQAPPTAQPPRPPGPPMPPAGRQTQAGPQGYGAQTRPGAQQGTPPGRLVGPPGGPGPQRPPMPGGGQQPAARPQGPVPPARPQPQAPNARPQPPVTGPPPPRPPGRPQPGTVPAGQTQSRPTGQMPPIGATGQMPPVGPGRPANAAAMPGQRSSSRAAWWITAALVVAVVVTVIVAIAMANNSSSSSSAEQGGSCWDGGSGSPCPPLEGQEAVDYLFAETEDTPERTCSEQDVTALVPEGAIEAYGCQWDDLDKTGLFLLRYESVDAAEETWVSYTDSASSSKTIGWGLTDDLVSGKEYTVEGTTYYIQTYCYDQVPFCAQATSEDPDAARTASGRWDAVPRDVLDEVVGSL